MNKSDIKITKLDVENIDYSPAVYRLYQIGGWESPPDCVTSYQFHTSKVKKALRASYCSFGAFDGDVMVGFFRALSDGVDDAYLLELIVDPQYRKLGIGKRLCECIVEYLKSKNIKWITAIGTPDAFALYTNVGEQMHNHTPFNF